MTRGSKETPSTPTLSATDVASDSVNGYSTSYTFLRRTTRSNTTIHPSPVKPLLDLAKYAYDGPISRRRSTATPIASPGSSRTRKAGDATTTPRSKRPKIKDELVNNTPTTPTSKRNKVKHEPATPPTSDQPSTPKSSSKKPMPLLALDRPHPEPPKWRQQYALIERMRKGIVAPVDDMGCERPRTTTEASPKTLRFHILISLMLSSQTKDAVTSQAVTNLHQTLPGGLTAESLAAAPVDMVYGCINKVGFWRRKTEYIQDAAKTLLKRKGEDKGDVPNTLEGLCELKGVGPKMAFLALQCAWDINAGIGVDVHVHRITNRLRWHKPQTSTPEQTRLNLQSWLPSELHKPINPMLVGFGQVICLPVGPRCDLCLLGQRKLCPSRVNNVKAEGRKEVSYTFTSEGNEGGAKVEIEYEEVKVEGPTVKALVKMEDEDLVKDEPEDVKVEAGLTLGEERVLDILDQVDGSKDIGA